MAVVVGHRMKAFCLALCLLLVAPLYADTWWTADSSFVADSSLDGVPSLIVPLPDDGVLVANGRPGRIVKLRKDGSLDPKWSAGVFRYESGDPAISLTVIAVAPDGRVLVGGSFVTFEGEVCPSLVRLNADGSFDRSFSVDDRVTEKPVTALALQADGRILVSNGCASVVRLLTNGGIDRSFVMEPLDVKVTPPDSFADSTSILNLGLDANGRVLVGAQVYRMSMGSGIRTSRIVRLRSDGAIDTTYQMPSQYGRLVGMRVLDDSGVLIAAAPMLGSGLAWPKRFAAEGNPDPGYATQPTMVTPAFAIRADGRLVYCEPETSRLRFVDERGNAVTGEAGGIGRASVIAWSGNDRLFVAGDFTLFDGVPSRRVARLIPTEDQATEAPRVVSVSADKVSARCGETVTVRATVSGSPNLTYEWKAAPLFDPVITATPELKFSSSIPAKAALTLTVRNARGDVTSLPLEITIEPDAPIITAQPTKVSAQTGRDLSVTVEQNASAGDTTAEWKKDGELLIRDNAYSSSRSLWMRAVTSADAGIYVVTLRNTIGESVTSAPITITIDDSSRFVNLSARASVGGGEKVLIAGFTVAGERQRQIIVRGIGPSLARYGVTNAVADPILKLFGPSGGQWTLYDDWDASFAGAWLTSAFASLGAFPLDAGSKDAVISAYLPPGSYTVHLISKTGESATGLVEVYEYDNDAARMLNLSARAYVASGAPAIAGLAIRGPVSKRVLVRAVGPGLAAFGVSGVLPAAHLVVKNELGAQVAANDVWEANPNLASLRAAMASATGFPLAEGSKDAALLLDLSPGNYTAIVEPTGSESGVVLVEAYEVE